MGVLTHEEIHAGMLALQQGNLEDTKIFVKAVKEKEGNIDTLLPVLLSVINEFSQLEEKCLNNTLLGEAASHGNVEAAKFLLDEGAEANSHEALALMHASILGQLEMVRFLVDTGKADTTVVNNDGYSALSYALQTKKIDVLLYLLKKPLPCFWFGEDKAILLWATASGYAHIITNLLNANPSLDINTICPVSNKTALMLAAKNGHLAVVTLLVERGADTTIVNNKGHSALSCAAWHNKLNVLQYLLEKPLPHFCFGEDKEILLWAAASGRIDIITNLLNANSSLDINIVYHTYDNTALMLAARNGNLAVVRLLVERGADTTIVNNKGVSALDYAMWYNHPGVVQYLRKRLPDHSLYGQGGAYTSSSNQINAADINSSECYQHTRLTNDDNVSINAQSSDPASTLLSTSFATLYGPYMAA